MNLNNSYVGAFALAIRPKIVCFLQTYIPWFGVACPPRFIGWIFELQRIRLVGPLHLTS